MCIYFAGHIYKGTYIFVLLFSYLNFISNYKTTFLSSISTSPQFALQVACKCIKTSLNLLAIIGKLIGIIIIVIVSIVIGALGTECI